MMLLELRGGGGAGQVPTKPSTIVLFRKSMDGNEANNHAKEKWPIYEGSVLYFPEQEQGFLQAHHIIACNTLQKPSVIKTNANLDSAGIGR
jgi:hypothetical protein